MGRELAPVIVAVMMFMIPIVAILVKHQQKMAIIMRTHVPQLAPTAETETVRRELAELKGLMHQQAIAIDNLSRKVEASTELAQRLENVGR